MSEASYLYPGADERMLCVLGRSIRSKHRVELNSFVSNA